MQTSIQIGKPPGPALEEIEQRIQALGEFPFMPNLYLVNRRRRFKAVCISKNGCSSLKQLTLLDDYPHLADQVSTFNGLHEFFGDVDNGRSMESVCEAKRHLNARQRRPVLHHFAAIWRSAKPKYTRFAVYRDPVDRVVSLYRNKFHNPEHVQHYYDDLGLIDCDFDTFLDFVTLELKKDDPEKMDEHIRPQARYFTPERDVDILVHLHDLDTFLRARFAVKQASPVNKTDAMKRTIRPSAIQHEKLRQLYEEDYRLAEQHADRFFTC